MCNPALIMAGLAAGAQVASQHQEADAAQATADNAAQAAQVQRSGLMARELENNIRTTQEMSERQRQYMRTQSSIRAATAESGLAGVSPLRNLVVSSVNASLDNDTIALNNQFGDSQVRRDLDTVTAQRTARIDAALGSVPSAFGSVLQVTNAGLQGFAVGDAIEARRT